MIRFAVLFALFSTVLAAQETTDNSTTAPEEVDPIIFEAGEIHPEEILWVYRAFVIFADSPNDPRINEQLNLISERESELRERDVIVIVDTDRSSNSEWRTRLRPNGFSIVLMSKDGSVVFRKPHPWTVREISRSIDKLPLRQQELQYSD